MSRSGAWAAVAVLIPSMAVGVAPAQATPVAQQCRIVDFSPRSTSAGLKATNVKFQIRTLGCDVNAWSLAVQRQPIASQQSSTVPLRPADMDNTDAGPYDISVWVHDSSGRSVLRDFPRGFRILRGTAWGSMTATTHHAAPGTTVKLSGRLMRADWNRHQYVAYPRSVVQVQVSTPAGWHTVRTTRLPRSARLVTTVRPTTSGQWRLRFPGNGTHSPATSPVQTITVRPA